MNVPKPIVFAFVAPLLTALGVAGYVLGSSEAPSSGEAISAREVAADAARRDADALAFHQGLQHGRSVGQKRGKAAGARAGNEEGTSTGTSAATKRADALAAREAAAVAAAEDAAATAPAPPELCESYEACSEPDAILNQACPPGQLIVNGACQPPPPGYLPGDILPGDSE